MKIVYTPKCLEYERPGHPESPQRVRSAAKYLQNKNYSFVEPEECSQDRLLMVHSPSLVTRIKFGDFFSLDSPPLENIFHYAKLAVGGAILASEIGGFSLMRPPGHHASKNKLGGFCYFNNIAVAVALSGKKTLIIDIDGHHGNGTQDIFAGSKQVKYISIHRRGYPGTGKSSKKNYLNYLFSSGPGDESYLQVLDKLLDLDEEFDQVAVSAGFDAYIHDPLASLNLSSDCYRRIGMRIRKFGLPVFAVLEGGYVSEMMGKNIHNFIQGITGK